MKNQPRCAYCGEVGKSKEHIFPSWLIAATPNYGMKLSRIKGKVGPNENVVHDVCTTCNNGPLSQLDEYCRKLYDRQLSRIIRDTVKLEYDFTLLTRWLLKVAFNSARHQKAPLASFSDLKPYMLGKEAGPPSNLLFLAEAIKPFAGDWGGEHVVIEPRDHRSGNMYFRDKPSFALIREGRFVAIDSFYFYFMFLHAPADDTICETIKRDLPASCVRLTPGTGSVELSPERDYFDVKLHEIGMNRDAYLEAYVRYSKPGER